jgi:Tol biopolymer transport system component
LTNDTATYSSPAFSPDCSRIAVVKDDRRSAVPGTDIVIIDVNNPGEVRRVTTDYTTYTESTPRWTADGSQLVFAAATSTNPGDNDIVLVNANGTGAPMILVKNEANDINPVISPDGQYLAFSSNRQGNYNIYIQRLADGELWQLTDETNDVFVGDWWQ